jgi:hypothetical protein
VRALIQVTGAALLLAATAFAVDNKRSAAGTLARPANAARAARLAEIAKDATPPKPGGSQRPLGAATSRRGPGRTTVGGGR